MTHDADVIVVGAGLVAAAELVEAAALLFVGG